MSDAIKVKNKKSRRKRKASMRICPNCSKVMIGDRKNCPSCGFILF
jgi:rRNA maturation endonuclease Nob1